MVSASRIIYFLYVLSGVRLSQLGTAATTVLLYQPRMIDDECGAVGGMRICRGNLSPCHFVHHESHMT
jgi:hypothetical protein